MKLDLYIFGNLSKFAKECQSDMSDFHFNYFLSMAPFIFLYEKKIDIYILLPF